MTKKELRKLYRDKRSSLSPKEINKLDDLLLIQFQRLAFDDATEWVMSYFAMHGRVEIDPWLFVSSMKLALPHLQVACPVVDVEQCTMTAHVVDDATSTTENSFGIEEPINAPIVEPDQLDVVLVPLLAFDESGYRVGYGKGFYDRFLALCKPNVIAVGFSYFEAVANIDDANQFDIPLNYCITPQKLYEF